MNELQVFTHTELGGFRALEINGEPWFIGKDVTSILGYGNDRQALKTNVDSEDKAVHSMDTLGGKQNMTIINESGLYSLILSSKLPKAKKFKHWVTSEVLPAIRKNGVYFKGNEMDIVIKAVTDTIMQQLPAIVAETVKTVLNVLPESKQNLKVNALDWNEISFWENLLSEWRDFRNQYASKGDADVDFLKNCKEKYPNVNIGHRTLHRKWRNYSNGGSTALIDKRGRHGNHRRKVVVTVEIEDAHGVGIEE